MSFPRYPSYKDSDVEWLGEVPKHWDVVQFKQFVDIQNGSDHKHVEQADGYPVLGSGGIFTYASDFLYDGESVLLGRKGTIDKPLHITGRFWTVDTMYWTKINPGTSGRFTYYSALTIPFEYYSTNTALPSMTKGALNSHLVVRPPLPEQTQIAAFLDRETAKIDELVAEQRRLMELLKEKRQAVISHAVTKGLNPDSPMKPSGIEWLGEVPAHWRVKRIKHLIAVLTDFTANGSFASLAENVTYRSEGYSRLVRLTDLRESLNNEGIYVDESAHHYLVKSELFGGEVLIANVGAYAGYACQMPYTEEKATLGPNMYLIRFKHDVLSNEYGLLCLMSLGVQEQLKIAATSTAQPKLNKNDVKGSVTVIPPSLEEQAEILAFLNNRTEEIDSLTDEAERAIDLLQERRTALISAAVTGQIDVRQLTEKQAA